VLPSIISDKLNDAMFYLLWCIYICDFRMRLRIKLARFLTKKIVFIIKRASLVRNCPQNRANVNDPSVTCFFLKINLLIRFNFVSGEMEIINHKTGDKCHMKFEPYSYFGGIAKKVTGTVITKDEKVN
jgi:hypothetical protein